MTVLLKSMFCVIYFSVLPFIYGCGQASFGQGRTINFTVSGFKLPAAMAYSEKPGVTAAVPTISITRQNAETVARNLIMQSVEEVLYQQGRSAGLLDNVISLILQQLTVNITYNPLKCDEVITNPTMAGIGVQNVVNCIIIGETVTGICMYTAAGMMCQLPANADKHMAINSQHLTIIGTFMTNNIVMANWSNQMWQSILNRVLRTLASSTLGSSHFYGAIAPGRTGFHDFLQQTKSWRNDDCVNSMTELSLLVVGKISIETSICLIFIAHLLVCSYTILSIQLAIFGPQLLSQKKQVENNACIEKALNKFVVGDSSVTIGTINLKKYKNFGVE